MNKTVNINLASMLFHIDEDAYHKLQNYLDTIKRSFKNEQGRDEIISDIEARIAELFTQKLKNNQQVISLKEVDEIITIMGQPEDYHINDESYEEPPKATQQQTRTRPLFRDPFNSYAGGVASGLGHYFGIDAIWIRLLWIILTVGSTGAFILIYLGFWIFVPQAKTTAEQLAMRGEPVNISNIERKIKEGFETVSDSVKNADYKKYGSKMKSSSSVFFENLGSIFTFLLKSFGKIIGLLFVISSGIVLVSLFLALFGVTTFNLMGAQWIDYVTSVDIGVPLWLGSVLVFLIIGIPFSFMFILGLKMLINNLKPIGNTVKLSLLGIWFTAVFVAGFLGVRQATVRAFNANVTTSEPLQLNPTDTLRVGMVKNDRYIDQLYHNNRFEIKKNEQNEKVLVLRNIKIYITSVKTGSPTITITKKAQGKTYDIAKKRAEAIEFGYQINENTLLLDGYAISNYENKYADQKMKITLLIPETMTLFAEHTTKDYNNNSNSNEYTAIKYNEGRFLKIENNKLICSTCPQKEEWEKEEWDNESNTNHEDLLKIDENGIHLHTGENKEGDAFDLKIDEHGIRINN